MQRQEADLMSIGLISAPKVWASDRLFFFVFLQGAKFIHRKHLSATPCAKCSTHIISLNLNIHMKSVLLLIFASFTDEEIKA